MKLFTVAFNKDCPKCNWKVATIYVFADTKEEAAEVYDRGFGLCAECICEQIDEKKYEIVGG